MDPQAEFVDVAVHDNDVMMRSGSCMVYSRLVAVASLAIAM